MSSSSSKENLKMGNNSSQPVKLEPSESRIPAALKKSSSFNVKPEPVEQSVPLTLKREPLKNEFSVDFGTHDDAPMDDIPEAKPDTPEAEENPASYVKFESVNDIEYTPELALQQGLKMVADMEMGMQVLDIGPRRKEVWGHDTANLRSSGVPKTLIAICGDLREGTGAGKSSILNAILDDNIVPTSGMRACTAVVTEIAYNAKNSIDADISFLSREEWKSELQILVDDLTEEDGTLKRTNDLKSDAGVAWQKVHAVYPTIDAERLVKMTPDQIISSNAKIERILGATKNISATSSKKFGIEIGKYIDSKDQKRGKDKDKKNKDKDRDPNAPAFWPLIRQVNVRAPSAALATGAILVDLPGTGDANAARNGIARQYMKKANCIWILAPIHRAVDSKVAKDLLGEAFRTQLMMDGGYDAHTITFIATKCDDISCSEVISNLHLDDDPELEDIQERIHKLTSEMSDTKKKRTAADTRVKALNEELSQCRAIAKEHQAHLTALRDGETFEPILTSKQAKKTNADKSKGSKKRKNTRGGKPGSPKRHHSVSDDESEEESDYDSASDSDDTISDVDSDDDAPKKSKKGKKSKKSKKDSDDEDNSDSDEEDSDAEKSDEDDDDDQDELMEEEVTEESLEKAIADGKKKIADLRASHNEARKERKEAVDLISSLKEKVSSVQKEKNGFCAKKRSEFSKDVLKEDFRSGLKDLDDAAAEERDPDNFDPSKSLRDYDAIDLPVFCVSARDYVRIKKQVRGDGDPTCFTNADDTGIPAVQSWVTSLTVSSREQAARNFLTQLETFAKDVRSFADENVSVTPADRDALRNKWESGMQEQPDLDDQDEEDDPFAAVLGGYTGPKLHTMPELLPKVDRFGQPIGITPRLIKEFSKVVENSVISLKDHLRDGLEERCRVGASNAAEAAVITSDDFASSMHWASYRATLRRHGEYRRDLNVELVNPFTRNIAQAWQQVFEADVFTPLLNSILERVSNLVKDVEKSAASGLKDYAKSQGETCRESARVALTQTVASVKATLIDEQKTVSRSVAPYVKDQLLDGYELAMEERGTGSVARQKAVFRNYISNCKDTLFEDGADSILEQLDDCASSVGVTLNSAMVLLAQKVENNISVLWEEVRDDPKQTMIRSKLVAQIDAIVHQVHLLSAAAAKAKTAKEMEVDA
ncbi:hypothetical protein MIND_00697600 [Mycena indigotica]|uniref:Nuclear GTPase SLIP-GC n=1 Tax=Mycena indigotica TaxID=2126181 RepID=A0A8H6SKC9_9AGAR|nr:uncharacterized protein MIND_00697600 [Mycena indigotica]KAF7301325.1 hypothetical protein MIND_00697600 [Mycena indigotica]